MSSTSSNDICRVCSMNREMIKSRGTFLSVSNIYGRVIDDLTELTRDGYICRSCSSIDSKICVDCGLSESVMKENSMNEGDIEFVDGSEFPIVHRCPDCSDRNERYEEFVTEETTELYTCEYCGREWDGYAQCPCTMECISLVEADKLIEIEITNIMNILETYQKTIGEEKYHDAKNLLNKIKNILDH